MSCAIILGLSITAHIGFSHNNFNDTHPYINCQASNGEYVGATINSHYDPVVYYGIKKIDEEGDMVDTGVVFGYHTYPMLPYVKLGTETKWVMPADISENGGFAWVIGNEASSKDKANAGINYVNNGISLNTGITICGLSCRRDSKRHL